MIINIKTIATISIIMILLLTVVIIYKKDSFLEESVVNQNNQTNYTNEVGSNFVVVDTNSAYEVMRVLSSEGSADIIKKEVFEILKNENIDLDIKDTDGKTPLMYATFNNDSSIMEAIIKKNIDINNVDSVGRTALHWASFYGNENAIIILLENGIDINIKDTNYTTALDLAYFEGHKNIIRMLESLKSD